MLRRLLSTFLIILYFNPVKAAEPHFAHITSKDGLPHQQIGALCFDNDGMLWIGSRNGLSKYDGYSFTNYFNTPGNPNSLNNNFICYLYIDKEKRLWVGTHKGICMYRPETDDFKCYPLDLIQTIVENSHGEIIAGGRQLYIYDEKKDKFTKLLHENHEFIISMAIDKKDRLYIATNKSILYYDSSFSKATQINPAYFADFTTGADGIIPLKFDSQGRLWIGRNGKGVMCINLTTNISKIYTHNMLSDGTVRVITEDSDGKIWLGTEKGITVIDKKGLIKTTKQNFADDRTLNDNAIYAITPDSFNNLWIGTYFGGINVLYKDNEQFQWIKPGYGTTNVKGKAVRQILELDSNTLWLASEDGGINTYNTATGTISVFDKIPNMGRNIHSLNYDKDSGEMWIGTFRNGLFCYNMKTGAYDHYMPSHYSGLNSDMIFDIERSPKGVLWIATTQGLRYLNPGSKHFNKINHPSLDHDFIYTLMTDKDGNLWIGTCNYGLFCIDAKTGEIDNWSAKNNTILNNDYVTCLFQDSKGRIWVGTNNEGIRFVDPSDMKLRMPSKELALPNSSICSIIEDNNSGMLWISTSDGLFRLDREQNSIIRYTTEEGLPTNQFNFSSSIQASNGILYFGTVNGLVYFNPSILKERQSVAAVHLSKLIINDQVINAGSPDSPLNDAIDKMDKITLSYNESRSFSIEYGIIQPANAAIYDYQVKLEGGGDKGWRNIGKVRRFVGLNLAPGSYKLLIRANNSGSDWDKAPVKAIEIEIRPPFYRSTIAYLIYLLIVGGIGFLIYRMFAMRMYERNAVKMANIEKEKSEEISKTKMEFFTAVSHELKTPLSLIKAPLKYVKKQQELSPDTEKKLDIAIKNADKILDLIDELVTFNRVESGNTQFYLQQGNPLDLIEATAQFFKESAFDKNITFYIHCQNNGEEVWFSPIYVERIINNLLSNALKYTPSNGKIVVMAEITDKSDGYMYLRIEVKDSGIGISKDEFDNIFTKYYRTKRGHNMSNRGWGLGLSLVKKLAEIHKGSVSVDSEIGKGSTFVVYLNVSSKAFSPEQKISSEKTIVPLEHNKFEKPIVQHRATTEGETTKNDAEIPQQESKYRLAMLIVEDNPELLDFLSGYFKKEYSIYTATNGKDALEIAQKDPIQMIISDVMMPEIDGYALCHILKNDIHTSHIPIILLTAKNETDDVMKGYESGAEAYVTKPFDLQILDLQVKNIMKIVSRRQKNLINETVDSDNDNKTQMSKPDEEFFSKINDLINKNIDNNEFSVADITSTLSISRSLLHTKMKSLLNLSIGDYIRKKRLNLAKKLLRDGYNVSETAYRTGFADPNYFSKVFKKEFGMTPTEFIDNKDSVEPKDEN